MSASSDVALRTIEDSDLPILFDHQDDPEATAMAAFPARDRAMFDAHWRKVRTDATVVARTIVADASVVGYIVSWRAGDQREVGYWIGRAFWGRGHATRALEALLRELPDRPLFAHVAEHNVGSRRVLERCGFLLVARAEADGVLESIFRHD